jgi:hypothetical protein
MEGQKEILRRLEQLELQKKSTTESTKVKSDDHPIASEIEESPSY